MENGIRMIIENPYNGETFLKTNFVLPPTIVDKDRSLRGDFFRKPTAYWFIGCNNTYGFTEQKNKEVKTICEVCGHANPEFVSICQMCSNYLMLWQKKNPFIL
jgi:hypothetical protein